MFDDKFLENLPENAFRSVKDMCEEFFRRHYDPIHELSYENYTEALGLLEALIESNNLNFPFPELRLC